MLWPLSVSASRSSQQVAPAPAGPTDDGADRRSAGRARAISSRAARQPVLADRDIMLEGATAHRAVPLDVSRRKLTPLATLCQPPLSWPAKHGGSDGPALGRRAGDRGGPGLAGPLAGVILADMGAEVIKVEKPDGGDDARLWGPPFVGRRTASISTPRTAISAPSCWTSRCRPMSTKLKALVRDADILIQNLRPGIVDEIGIGPEAMLARQPAADLLLDLGLRLPGADAQCARLRPTAAGLWRRDDA